MMDYFLTFLEGIASFLCPCLLPMIPVYLTYFAGDDDDLKKTFINALSFILGFTTIFVLLSIFSSSFGAMIFPKIKYIKIIFGLLIIFFGLNYMGLLKISIPTLGINKELQFKKLNFIKSYLFGIFFACNWRPCMGSFLASTLLMISNEKNIQKGILMMIFYSIGFGLPFIISAVMANKLKSIFNFIKRYHNYIEKCSGIMLIASGIYILLK